MGDVNRWELTSASGVGMLLPFSVLSLGGCKSLALAAPAVVLPGAVSSCVWIHRRIRCWVLLCCWFVDYFYA